ncbi:hypothetical protein BJY04DRAFT_215736 [Aspergillus karnatakaensis]|uniref:uncharacterized protein n=1 Tax=Aspergillus karnatakaensis TaxID=1810916 RepID=UPI003CCDE70D
MFSTEEYVAAIKGEAVPSRLTGRLSVCSLVRGIRYHDGFAQELYGDPELPMVTRSLNARAIMSNRIPVMTAPEQFPYCFWYPEVPREETLRQLLAQYPDCTLLRYQVGRACAVGGYSSLYQELGLLPDVAIAEEARDNTVSGQMIYDSIMEAPVRYAYMDDYNRCLRPTPMPGACLNGDTCVRSMLDNKEPVSVIALITNVVFDITEDRCIDIEGIEPLARPVDPQAVALLHAPLPTDLPTVDKDLLILMAVWSGNIDRYARLRRPRLIEGEIPCVVRGIHHHSLFAKWWLTQRQPDTAEFIVQAIHARCVMNNDLSWLTENTLESELPNLIWYPHVANKATYRELVRRRPSMAYTVARACIHADYEDLFSTLHFTPDKALYLDADNSDNNAYLQSVKANAANCGIDLRSLLFQPEDWTDPDPHILLRQDQVTRGYATQSIYITGQITLDHLGFRPEDLQTVPSTVGQVLLLASMADPARRPQ